MYYHLFYYKITSFCKFHNTQTQIQTGNLYPKTGLKPWSHTISYSLFKYKSDSDLVR